ncbi:thymidine kinase [Teichococcus oryzae]|uniref:Thymidine kinase n=1 Tax=Teichococcus oryzae TaxID=1608942 RepID=A0A5B2TEJ1_9PROT|nr:thymidine kinase [Pseudoroseomonas oryzae]KAA2212877.1 thymidine kinase [Pseudoroseomonas oryzae]
MARGQLTVFCGPMFAGKSTALLEQAAHARARGLRARLLKPAFDTRRGAGRLTTHDGLSMEAAPVATLPGLGSPEIPHGTGTVLLDEIQFMESPSFDGDVVEGIRALLLAGVDVTAGGLDMDWQGRPFRTTGMLCAMATSVTKLRARCAVCGAPATMTQKTGGDAGRAVELGAGDLYQARCGTHWRPFSCEAAQGDLAA